jgi:predicted DCC family thiol-disulfide oxidoreductase YuxK
METDSSHIVLYDGKCNFCNAIVNYIIAKDKKQVFSFAPLQSKEARKLLREHNEAFASLKTVYLVENGNVYKRSKAVFYIFRTLGYPYALLSWFRFLPVFITDAAYKFVAKNRYRWFGEAEAVIVPDEKVKERFLKGVFEESR